MSVRCRGSCRYAVPCRNQTADPSGCCHLHVHQAAYLDRMDVGESVRAARDLLERSAPQEPAPLIVPRSQSGSGYFFAPDGRKVDYVLDEFDVADPGHHKGHVTAVNGKDVVLGVAMELRRIEVMDDEPADTADTRTRNSDRDA